MMNIVLFHIATSFPWGPHMRRLLFVAFLLTGCLPALALAQPATWVTPAGGETWTPGTAHTLAWTGGAPTVFGIAAYAVPGPAVWPISPQISNTGYVTWNLPTNLPAGTYILTIGFVGDTSYNSQPITISGAPPSCLVGCYLQSASTITSQGGFPPIGACAFTAQGALDAAAALATAQLESQCSEGYSLDPGSIVMDVTLIPTGVCYAGFFGTFVAEASGFGCCCPDAVPNEAQSWGSLKATFH